VNVKLERIWKEAVLILRHHPGIRLERLRKTTKTISQDISSSGRDLSPEPCEYEAGVLTIQILRLVVAVS
jgi:hypothetical protein